MVLTCPKCQSESSLDDKKIPDKPFQAKCSQCGHIFPVDPKARDTDDPFSGSETDEMAAVAAELAEPSAVAASDAPVPPASLSREEIIGMVRQELRRSARSLPAPGSPVPAMAFEDEHRFLGAELGIDEGKKALVCEPDDERAGQLQRALETLGFDVERARRLQEATKKLEGEFQIISVAEKFPDEPEGGQTLLRKLAGMSPDRRRATLVTFVTSRFKSGDGLAGFVLAADLVIASADVPRAVDLIKEGIRSKEKLYRAYHRAQAKLLS